MEIEIRARIEDRHKIEENILAQPGVRLIEKNAHQSDHYFRHEADIDQKLIIRIRREAKRNLLSFKGRSLASQEDIAWEDFDVEIEKPERLERLLAHTGFEQFLQIEKFRTTFHLKGVEIDLDEVTDLGSFIEVEARGEASEISSKKQELVALLSSLGIPERAIIQKGYVALMKESQRNS